MLESTDTHHTYKAHKHSTVAIGSTHKISCFYTTNEQYRKLRKQSNLE